MTKIFKQLARHWAACLAVVALLIAQAYCDLSLPDYTSKIVDIGIQQGGIESPVPETIRDTTLQALELLMPEDTAAQVDQWYSMKDVDGLWHLLPDADMAELETAFTTPDVVLYMAAAQNAAQAAGSAETDAAPAESFDPAAWRAGDTSPEAEATRKMYEAGLTLSALNGQPMDDALIPPMDNSAEAVARRKLYAACLSKSAQDGEKQAVPYADWSAEKQAEYKLQAADLTTQGSAADTVSADMTQVDALSGATITSTAVTDIVNNSYFYVTEVLCAE